MVRGMFDMLAPLVTLALGAQSHSGFPIDVVPGPAPQPVVADGRTRMIYELHVTNYAPLPVEVTAVEVLGAGDAVLASIKGPALQKAIIPVEKLSSAGSPPGDGGALPVLAEGHSALVFLDVALEPGARAPAELRHRISLACTPKNGKRIEPVIEGVATPVVAEAATLIAPPLRGSGWVAFNALGAVDHRRSLNAVDGRERIPQRFAVDWVQLGPDGRPFHGDGKKNEDYYDEGVEVLAVADGRVAEVKDGLPENLGANERSGRAITLDNIVGNYVVLDLGRARFALYAHLRPGSLRVKAGDAIKTGQPLGRLGNSGNSDAPHLHFQLMDSASPLGSEGLPFALGSFTQLGTIEDEAALLEKGQPWRSTVPATEHRGEFPLDKAVLRFP
jgi:hypothetical protein